MQNRKQDLLDIFTFEIQDKTYGMNARVSFLQLGLFYQDGNNHNIGIRKGIYGNLDHYNFSFIFLGSEHFKGKKFIENPEFEKEIINIQKNPEKYKQIPKKLEEYYKEKDNIIKENLKYQKRNKFYDVYLPFGTNKTLKNSNNLFKEAKHFTNISFYTDAQIQLGLYYGITIGINIGELVDFIIGIFTLDILNDDLK
ncbi:MAG: hypothetical protein KatS3mg129_1893 [Leptospiraceae bacterium]|nr:MAG: hypothetical protein KatS3mg129_1893 [Leptospiraceae bacterium]